MTVPQLEKGKEIFSKMKRLQEFSDAFHGSGLKCIKVFTPFNNKDFVELNIDRDSKLYEIIDDYVGQEIENISKQFEKI